MPRILSALLTLLALANAACYYPDGTVVTVSKKTCDSKAEFSACCDPSDFCINGLCKSQYDANVDWLWREGCTDPRWESPLCPRYCQTTETASYAPEQVWQVLDCGSGEYCCTYAKTDGTTTANGTSCCGDERRRFVIDAVGSASSSRTVSSATVSSLASTIGSLSTGTTASTSISTSSELSTSTTSSSPLASATSPAAASQKQGMTTGATAGVGVGAAVGGIAIASIAALLWTRSKKQRPGTSDREFILNQGHHSSELDSQGMKLEMGVKEQKVELGQTERVHPSELPSFNTGPPAELDTVGKRTW